MWVCGSGCVVMALGWWLWRGHVCVCVCVCDVVVVFVGACVFVCVRCGVVVCVLRCCVAVVGGGLCGCTCIVWADGDWLTAWWRVAGVVAWTLDVQRVSGVFVWHVFGWG